MSGHSKFANIKHKKEQEPMPKREKSLPNWGERWPSL